MAVTVHLSGHLRTFSNGELRVTIEGDLASVAEVLGALWMRHPALRDRILDDQGEIRTHVNIFDGSNDVKRLDGLSTMMRSDELHIFNAVSGG
ncbi:MAG TPA: hypothetical protein PKD26_16565 [Pyrinomonadaceae bacterium]|nr:hypothetical protein [Pyrinomonadaceae bacterium]